MNKNAQAPAERGAGWYLGYAALNGNRYGVRFAPTWPHVSLGISAHIGWKFGHLTLHLPFGLLIIGCTGSDEASLAKANIRRRVRGMETI